jgi:AcrR family transcriptional regulator
MPAPSRRPYAARLSPQDRRKQLLDAALRIIIRDGYGAVSIETIAREVDVSRPAIYGVFEGSATCSARSWIARSAGRWPSSSAALFEALLALQRRTTPCGPEANTHARGPRADVAVDAQGHGAELRRRRARDAPSDAGLVESEGLLGAMAG